MLMIFGVIVCFAYLPYHTNSIQTILSSHQIFIVVTQQKKLKQIKMKQVKNPVAFESNFAIHNLFTIQDGSIVVDGGVIFTIYELTEKI